MMDSNVTNSAAEYLTLYPCIIDLVLPDIPTKLLSRVTIVEECIFQKRELEKEIVPKTKKLLHEDNYYTAVWMHEAYESFINPHARFSVSSVKTLYKVRFLIYKDYLNLAIIRRKWPQKDFLIVDHT